MSYNIDRLVNEIRNYHRTVNAMKSEFQAWKDEVRQEIAELKLTIERNTFRNYPAPEDHPEDSDETLDHKWLLVKKYHTQLNRFTQVVCTNLSNKLLADAHVDKNKLSWKEIPADYKNEAYAELEELALQANIPLNRCVNSWGAQVLLAKSYNNYRNKKPKNKQSNTASSLLEQIDDINSEENLDFELLPDLDASNELEEENSNEINVATSSSSAVSPLPPSPSPRTRSASCRQNKKRRM